MEKEATLNLVLRLLCTSDGAINKTDEKMTSQAFHRYVEEVFKNPTRYVSALEEI